MKWWAVVGGLVIAVAVLLQPTPPTLATASWSRPVCGPTVRAVVGGTTALLGSTPRWVALLAAPVGRCAWAEGPVGGPRARSAPAGAGLRAARAAPLRHRRGVPVGPARRRGLCAAADEATGRAGSSAGTPCPALAGAVFDPLGDVCVTVDPAGAGATHPRPAWCGEGLVTRATAPLSARRLARHAGSGGCTVVVTLPLGRPREKWVVACGSWLLPWLTGCRFPCPHLAVGESARCRTSSWHSGGSHGNS